MRISPLLLTLATAGTFGLGCGGPRAATPAASPKATPIRMLAAAEVFILEMTGVPPGDTTVTFAAGAPRTIILRHGAPDNNVFAELIFPATAYPSPGPDSVTATVHVVPGIYGMSLTLSTEPVAGPSIRFKYPVHFSAPLGAVQRYGSVARYEQSLAVAQSREPDQFAVLPSTRPGPDNIAAVIPGAGTYVVLGPRGQ
jgi:hypothetical protein